MRGLLAIAVLCGFFVFTLSIMSDEAPVVRRAHWSQTSFGTGLDAKEEIAEVEQTVRLHKSAVRRKLSKKKTVENK